MKLATNVVIAIGAAVAAAGALPAAADSPFALDRQPSLQLKFDRNALQTVQGAEAVYKALANGAMVACAGAGDLSTRSEALREHSACVDELTDAAIQKVGDANLRAVHESKVIESASLR